jgi:glycosyltransferase involved in cell wall biosynthesis
MMLVEYMAKADAEISVIMPVYNEEKTVGSILGRVLRQDCVSHVIVVDSSKDRSPQIIRNRMRKDRRITLIHTKKPTGKGSALITGIKKVRGGLVLIQDADSEYFPEDYSLLLGKLKDGNAVFGSRILGRNVGHQYALAKMANIMMSAAFSLFFRQRVTDIYTCYKLFDRKMVDPDRLRHRDFLIEAEIAAQIVRNGYKIEEVPIRYNGRTFEEGKKIHATDGIKGMLYIIMDGIRYSLGR